MLITFDVTEIYMLIQVSIQAIIFVTLHINMIIFPVRVLRGTVSVVIE